MATNNSTNNNFPSGLSATTAAEIISINTTGSGTTTIGSSLQGNFTLNSGGSSDGFFLNNANFSLNSGTGTVTINPSGATGAVSIGSSGTTLNITSVSSSGSVIISTGSSSTDATFANTGTTATTYGMLSGAGSGTVNFESTGDIKFGCNSTGSVTVNGSNINIGNSSISSTLNLNAGSACTIQPTTGTLTIGNTTGATSLTIQTGTNGIRFPTVLLTGTTTLTNALGPYISFNAASAGTTTLTLPTTVALGARIKFVDRSASTRLFKIGQQSGQTIYSQANTTTTGTGGSVTSTTNNCAIELVCVTANTDFVILNSQGSFTFV